MQNEKTKRMRKAWSDMPCDHPQFEKEYFLGSDSGDYLYTQCGRVFSRSQKEEIESNK